MRNVLSLLLVSLFLFTSCSTQRSIGNGAYSDISLERSSDQYKLKRLKEVNTSSKAIFGIPLGKKSDKQGVVVRFNGINLSAQQKFLPTLSMVALTVVTGLQINGILDGVIEEEALSYAASGIVAIPIAGAINNQIWSSSAYSRASWNANSELLEKNPEIDVFLNPKYQIKTKNGLWTQRVELKANVMGAEIITD
jgi:hypothetical protein